MLYWQLSFQVQWPARLQVWLQGTWEIWNRQSQSCCCRQENCQDIKDCHDLFPWLFSINTFSFLFTSIFAWISFRIGLAWILKLVTIQPRLSLFIWTLHWFLEWVALPMTLQCIGKWPHRIGSCHQRGGGIKNCFWL